MLKRFGVENFSSYQEKNYLDLTAGKTETNSDHVYDFEEVKVLKSAIVYGANASGKSNLIRALEYSKNIVIHGLNSVVTYKKYFRLDKVSLTKPTVFEFEIEIDNKFYSYGFTLLLSEVKIVEEWLYEIGNQKSECIFERDGKEINLGKKITSKNKVAERFKIYKEDMKNQSNQLFLTEISSKNLEFPEVEILNNIFNWFDKKLIILYPTSEFGGKASINEDEDLTKLFIKYLKAFDTGVVDIFSIEEDFEKGLKDLPFEVRKEIEKDLLKEQTKKIRIGNSEGSIYTVSKNDDNDLVVNKLGLVHNSGIDDVFELSDESDGTKRLFDLIPLIEKFSKNYTIVIDEFDRSLHPMLTKKFFELFYSLNNNRSQLIVTTHESTLLDLDLVRKDEIWFVEKDKKGASKIYSLNQFKVRYDKKIEKPYLLGRYGAIPIFKEFDKMKAEK